MNKNQRKSLARKNGNEILMWIWDNPGRCKERVQWN